MGDPLLEAAQRGAALSMTSDADRAKFRRQATTLHRCALAGLLILPLCTAGLGWWVGDLWGLSIGGIVGLMIAAAGAVAVTLLWAMSQDGG